ncbi:MAG: amidohydrolase [Bacteroidetes bacterium]|nr:MAG: amidohydrolase [Bacteroidota bacterium]
MMKPLTLLLAIVAGASMAAQAQDLPSKTAGLIAQVKPKLITWRRQIHQNPELGNREFMTGEMIAAHLRKLGIEVRFPVAKTGVVGVLKGAKPGPVVALRADMDALPVTERNDLPYKSTTTTTYNGQAVGVMHACGHDAHVAMLMGTAEVLAGLKNELPGTVVFIFQPAEEGPPEGEEGGAALMVKEGVMDNPKVDAVFGMHIESWIEEGKVFYKSGPFMASADWFFITVNGKQSHGSQPWLGIDPMAVGAQIVNGLQQIVSRQQDITKAPVVITVGKITGGVRENIIPEQIVLSGTIRTLDSDMQKDVHARLEKMAKGIAAANGATAEVRIDSKTLVTYNTPELLTKMLPSLEKAVGKANVEPTRWVTGAEDFSYYGTKAPALFLYYGGMPKGNDPAKAPPHHTPDFMISDANLDNGVKVFCQLVFDYARTK